MAGPGKPGREPMLTKDRYERLVALVRSGCDREYAAKEVGVTSHTIRKWLRWGADGRDPYAKFLFDIDQAAAAGTNRIFLRIVAAARNDWRAGAWVLRTTRPDLYGDKIQVSIEDGLRRFLDIAQHVLEPTQFTRLLEALTAEGGAAAPSGDRETDKGDG